MTNSVVLFGMGWSEIIPIGSGLVVFGIVMFVWFAVIEKDSVAARAKAIREHKRIVLAQQPTQKKKQRVTLARKNRLSNLAASMRAKRKEQTANIRMLLAVAGFRSNEAVGLYVLAKFIGPLITTVGGFILYYVTPTLQDLNPLLLIVLLVFTVLAGIGLPDLILGFLGRGRQKKIQGALPDALDLMVICTEAGLALDATFERVAAEMASSSREMSDELSLTSVEMAILPERSEALNNLTRRTNVQAIESVVSTLNQTERYGTPLAQSFRILASDFRDSRLLRAEEKAAKLPATLTIPMIGLIFPCLFAVLLGPAIIQTMNSF
ncbi:MAG: type II secretion system F family protein [Alphaproteobacteria bacterium]|nr:MAG: type II secretion system F family protein [Alphaproteobacteria bacterium]